MTVYVSVGVLFHLTIADHTESCSDSLVQLCQTLQTQNSLVQEQSLSNINTVLFSNV
jgi:hypothetical protein